MDLLPDESQQEIIDQTAAFLDETMPIDRCRTGGSAAARPDATQLAQMAELGWFGLALAEDRGGIGFSLAEESLLFREIGRRVGSVGLLATALAAHVADAADNTELRDQIVAGQHFVGWAEPLEAIDLTKPISGRFQVFDGSEASLWLVINDSGAVILDPATGSARTEHPCLDEFTQLLHVDLNASNALAAVGPEAAIFERAAVLAASCLVGIAEAARDQAAAYASERVQFGKPIGVFQAIKHPCADMAVRCEAIWAQTAYAVLALRDGHEDAAFQVSTAKSLAGDSATENAAANVQVHGGYGFTTEYDAHLLVKRTHILNTLAGTPRAHLGRVIAAPTAA
jgi:alkylation response protein AidB-like acyl-CoA dehydrogenase